MTTTNNQFLIQECIDSLRISSNKRGKFSELNKKINDRFLLCFAISVANVGTFTAGFDNHLNHQRPHIHIKIGSERISIAIDNGELLHKNKSKLKEKTLNEIKEWVLSRKKCLQLIYSNIQSCKSKEDFAPLINAMNKYFK